jgi:hypothetical protein
VVVDNHSLESPFSTLATLHSLDLDLLLPLRPVPKDAEAEFGCWGVAMGEVTFELQVGPKKLFASFFCCKGYLVLEE